MFAGYYRLTFFLLALLLLNACGFTLRGTDSATFPQQLQQIQLNYADNNTIGRLLRDRLQASGLELLERNAEYVLSINEERSRERIVSVNRNVRAGEYELTLITSWQLRNGPEILIDSGPLSLFRIYEADPDNPAAKTSEAELILAEMRQDLVSQIIRQLQNADLSSDPL